MDENLELRLALFQAENDYKLEVHKREITATTLIAVLTAIAAAIFSLAELILGCPCNLSTNSGVLLAFRVFNIVLIACTLIFNVANALIKKQIAKTKIKRTAAIKTTTIQEKIDRYNEQIAEEQKKQKRLKFVYFVAYCAIAGIELLLLILAFTVK